MLCMNIACAVCRCCGWHDKQSFCVTITSETCGKDHGAGTGRRPERAEEKETEERWIKK